MAPTTSKVARRSLVRKALAADFAVLPVKPRGKAPAVTGGVKAATKNKRAIDRHFRKHPSQNYGIATGSASAIFVIDIDGTAGRRSLEALEEQHGKLPATVTVRTGNGRHLYFAYPGSKIRNSAGKLGPGIDVKGDGGYVVGAGSVHPSGETYRYSKGKALGEIPIAAAPGWLLDLLTADRLPSEDRLVVGELTPTEARRLEVYFKSVWSRELDRLRRAPMHTRNDTLNRCAFCLGQFVPLGVVTKRAVTDALTTIARSIGLEPDEIAATIASGLEAGIAHPRPFPLRLGSADLPPRPKPDAETDLTKSLAELGASDADNARRLVARGGDKLLYAPGAGWLFYDGTRWKPDTAKQRIPLALETVEAISDEGQFLNDQGRSTERMKFAENSKSKTALDRMLAIAESWLSVPDNSLDADKYLLNVLNGTIDLKSGELLPHDPRDLITKLARIHFDPAAKCPTWRRVLKDATAGKKGLRGFLWRSLGYSLTGDTSEQAFFFVHGPGSTSKSTVVNTFRDLLADYGVHTPTETLIVKAYDNSIPNDIARLKGARMVTAIEANFGRQLDEAKLKAMTGGDNLTARYMRQEFFEFKPEFKLWIVANDFLRVRQSADAFWRRVRVVPFDIEVPADQQDRHLSDRLKDEWPGILAWAVRGCLAYQAGGLKEPPAVRHATRQWVAAADHVRSFVNASCILDPDAATSAAIVYATYKNWCAEHGETALSIAKFKVAMVDRNVKHARARRGSIWEGLKLKR